MYQTNQKGRIQERVPTAASLCPAAAHIYRRNLFTCHPSLINRVKGKDKEIVTFTDNWKNLRTQLWSSKAMNGYIS